MGLFGITILGLGPGDPEKLTCQAWNLLQNCSELYVRTKQHAVLEWLPSSVEVKSFDNLMDGSEALDAACEQIVSQVLELGQREEGVIYAVPGHPFVSEATCPEIARRASQIGIPVQIIDGLSFIEPIFSAIGANHLQQLTIMDAIEFSQRHAPLFPPHMPVLITHVHSTSVAEKVKRNLRVLYPDNHPVKLVHAAGTDKQLIEDFNLDLIDQSQYIRSTTSLFVPALGIGTSFEEFLDVVAHLRAPEGCPWDREQTHQSLRATLLEETYEVLDALDKQDIAGVREELGDLLLQVYLHAQIAVDDGEFTMADILNGIYTKILRRHPHVFAQSEVNDVTGVLVNWERIKAEERAANGKSELGLLDGVTKTLPALTQAEQYLKRVARVGFEWPDFQSVLEKLKEAMVDVDHASDENRKMHEVGDLLLAVVNLARWLKVDPESALRHANLRFKVGFGNIETYARKQGISVSDLSLAEMENLWRECK